jgi:hypothetical protein
LVHRYRWKRLRNPLDRFVSARLCNAFVDWGVRNVHLGVPDVELKPPNHSVTPDVLPTVESGDLNGYFAED